MSYTAPGFINTLLLRRPLSVHLLNYWRKKSKEQLPNGTPEELDGYQLERSAVGDQQLPTVTHSVVEISQPAQNQEENYTEQ